jgi:hypothetical protein
MMKLSVGVGNCAAERLQSCKIVYVELGKAVDELATVLGGHGGPRPVEGCASSSHSGVDVGSAAFSDITELPGVERREGAAFNGRCELAGLRRKRPRQRLADECVGLDAGNLAQDLALHWCSCVVLDRREANCGVNTCGGSAQECCCCFS